MFSKRKKEIEAINERLNQLEDRTRTLPLIERIEGHLDQLVGKVMTLPETTAPQEATEQKEEEVVLSEEKKIRAAYALNLCTVSVSQIVDYNDLYILEQEYDGILNNLNLENIPHDDVLLDILKRLLDTITFFRIQEGDKRFIEEEYNRKTRSAIWSAVPRLSVILTTGNPLAMVGALVSQVGIGYMNYRKEKAKINLEHEKELWQLQRSAIEQINALRRELFATAWKLADRYEFKDSYRLTERQISQYNQILMDPDPFRRYERLKNISGAFSAYPNFHFYIGDAANDIANEKNRPQYIKDYYKKMAIGHLREFNDLTSKPLLRIDPINAAGCLELAGLLDPVKDKEEIKSCLITAAEKAGNALDVIQLCALGFLRINKTNEAERYLRMLSVEGYNVNVNATLLSMLYYHDFTSTEDANLRTDIHSRHETLSWIAPSAVLLPLPEANTDEAKKAVKESFLKEKADVLAEASYELIDKLVLKYATEFNRSFLNPHPGADLPDEYFRNSEEWLDDLKSIFGRGAKKKAFLSRLAFGEQDYFEGILERVNKLDRTLQELPFFEDLETHILAKIPDSPFASSKDGQIKTDLEIIDEKLLDVRNKTRETESLINEGKYDQVSLKDILDTSLFKILTSGYDFVVAAKARMYLDKQMAKERAVDMFNHYENTLVTICDKEHIEISFGKKTISISKVIDATFYRRIGASLFDDKAIRVKKCIKDWFDSLDEKKKNKIRLYESGTEEFAERWSSIRKSGMKIEPPFSVNSLHAIMLRLDNGNPTDSELYLTTDALYYRKSMGFWKKDILASIPYTDFEKNDLFIPDEYDEINANELIKDIARILESKVDPLH